MAVVWITALVVFLVYLASAITTTVYLHRSVTHRSVVMHPALAFLMRLEIWLMTGQVPRYWAAVHRKHHQYADVAGDPHSPHLIGMMKLFFLNPVYTNIAGSDPNILKEYAPDVPYTTIDKVMDRSALGLALGALAFLGGFALWLGWWGLLAGSAAFLAHAILYVAATSTINSICHVKGYKNFDNTAGNLASIAPLTAGESLHNNHHNDQNSPRLSFRWWEIDPGWWLIVASVAAGLAERLPTTQEKMVKRKAA